MARGGTNIMNVAIETAIAVIFVVVASSIIAVAMAGGQLSALAIVVAGFIDVVLIALILYAAAKKVMDK